MRVEKVQRDRRRFLRLLGYGAMAAPAIIRAGRAQSPEISLRLHHFLPPVANIHTKFLAPWARKLESDAGGRLRIEILPSMQLGGTAADLFDQVRDGIVDIAWFMPASTPGRFPAIETFELPFVAAKRAVPTTKALTAFAGSSLKNEFHDVHPICFWAQDQGIIHATRPIKAVEDLRRLRLEAPTRFAVDALKVVGALGILMPDSQIRDALTQKAIDGCLMPWEKAPASKVTELTKYHAELPDSPTLDTSTSVLAMNKARYERLPLDLKQIFDANSGEVAAVMAATVFDEQAVTVSETVRQHGDTITALSEPESRRWHKACEPINEAWIRRLKERGLDGEKLLSSARSLVQQYDVA